MKQTPIKPRGKRSREREKGLAKFKREHPRPDVCEECGRAPDFRGLHPHHIKKRSQLGDESEDNLKWLCGICHDAEHGIKDA